ncbi:hypothetical protein PSACC_02192 [Paramicrosporidium saccamoebae]|uniref:Uncharacterized protein n=1 Tax=Paramicrosporidium saccamoebae TaxID=1246581 RepID=A0A2H9TJJ3_9FUNG|nr:hypothetical protein PSACC_02192 [Paramicrosporidium saccamoebae]
MLVFNATYILSHLARILRTNNPRLLICFIVGSLCRGLHFPIDASRFFMSVGLTATTFIMQLFGYQPKMNVMWIWLLLLPSAPFLGERCRELIAILLIGVIVMLVKYPSRLKAGETFLIRSLAQFHEIDTDFDLGPSHWDSRAAKVLGFVIHCVINGVSSLAGTNVSPAFLLFVVLVCGITLIAVCDSPQPTTAQIFHKWWLLILAFCFSTYIWSGLRNYEGILLVFVAALSRLMLASGIGELLRVAALNTFCFC